MKLFLALCGCECEKHIITKLCWLQKYMFLQRDTGHLPSLLCSGEEISQVCVCVCVCDGNSDGPGVSVGFSSTCSRSPSAWTQTFRSGALPIMFSFTHGYVFFFSCFHFGVIFFFFWTWPIIYLTPTLLRVAFTWILYSMCCCTLSFHWQNKYNKYENRSSESIWS